MASMIPPINFKQWIEDNRELLKPPVGNKCIYEDAEFIIMVVGGPNARKDYHFEEGEVWRMQHWARTELSLVGTGLPGGPPVTLRLYATDVGDSIYDSAILVDDIKIE